MNLLKILIQLYLKIILQKIDKFNFSIGEKENKSFKALLKACLYLIFYSDEAIYSQSIINNESTEIISLKQECLGFNLPIGEYYYVFALLEIKLRNISEAIELLKKALSLNPKLANAYAVLGYIHTFEHEWQKAKPYLEICVKNRIDINHQKLIDLCYSACRFFLGEEDVSGISDFSYITSKEKIDGEKYYLTLPKIDEQPFDHSDHNRNIIVVPSDSNYFIEHSLALILSIYDRCAEIMIHVHIYNPDERVLETRKKLEKLIGEERVRFSFEEIKPGEVGDTSFYFSSGRIFRIYRMLKINQDKRITLLDADSLCRKDIDKLPGINDGDWVMSERENGNTPPWEELNGAISTWRYSEENIDLLSRNLAFSLENIKNNRFYWFTGQLAHTFLHHIFKDQIKVKMVEDSLYYDIKHGDDAYIWGVTNHKNASEKYNTYKKEILAKYGFDEVKPQAA
jgi:tetratricopeptide (TPR) repeat protein